MNDNGWQQIAASRFFFSEIKFVFLS